MRTSTIELHLSALSVDGEVDLPRQYGAQIRAIGGRYSECRGDASVGTRFVTLPATKEGGGLAVALLQWYPRIRHGRRLGTIMIGRPNMAGTESIHDHAPIGGEPEAVARVLGAVRGTIARASLEAAERAEEEARAERKARPARLRMERERLLARVAEIDAELGAPAALEKKET